MALPLIKKRNNNTVCNQKPIKQEWILLKIQIDNENHAKKLFNCAYFFIKF